MCRIDVQYETINIDKKTINLRKDVSIVFGMKSRENKSLDTTKNGERNKIRVHSVL